MLYQNRDMGINHIKARKDHRCYGMGLGIIILDDVYPGFPGDVRNASAFPFPIQYEIAERVDIWALVHEEDKSPCREPILLAAKKLESMGCRAIAAECGYFAYFQQDVAADVDVPVFMSSLLQVPWAQQLIGPDQVVGILAARKAQLSDAHLEAVGIQPGSNYVVAGAEDDGRCPEFEHLWYAPNRPRCPSLLRQGRKGVCRRRRRLFPRPSQHGGDDARMHRHAALCPRHPARDRHPHL